MVWWRQILSYCRKWRRAETHKGCSSQSRSPRRLSKRTELHLFRAAPRDSDFKSLVICFDPSGDPKSLLFSRRAPRTFSRYTKVRSSSKDALLASSVKKLMNFPLELRTRVSETAELRFLRRPCFNFDLRILTIRSRF